MQTLRISSVFSSLFCAVVATAQINPTEHSAPDVAHNVQKDVQNIDAQLAEILARHDVPAIAAAVIKDGDVLAHGVAGVRERGADAQAEIGDKWHLGSCTKAMTATLCAILVKRGELSWHTTLHDVFPEVDMDPSWHHVTLDLLVRNLSGAPGNPDRELWTKLSLMRDTPRESRHELLVAMTKTPTVSEPGSQFLYSNAGFALAGHMTETVTGSDWEELVQREVFAPLGITSAGFGAPGTTETVDEPRGHSAAGKTIPPGLFADNPPAIGPAGTVHMTIDDWARFVDAHLVGEDHDTPLPISQDDLVRLHTRIGPDASTYAAGWMVTTRPWAKGDGPEDSGRVLTHNGTNTLWFCCAWLAPEREFAVIVTCNQGGDAAAKACDEAAAAMIRRFGGR